MGTEKRPPLVVDVGEATLWVQDGKGWLLGGGGWRPIDAEDGVPGLGGRVLHGHEVAVLVSFYGTPEVTP